GRGRPGDPARGRGLPAGTLARSLGAAWCRWPPRLSALTDWVYVDRASGRPRRVPREMEDAFRLGASGPQERDGWHAPPPPPRPARATHQVRVYEIDSLGHVNNAVYLDVVAQAAFEAIEQAGWPLARLVSDGPVPL